MNSLFEHREERGERWRSPPLPRPASFHCLAAFLCILGLLSFGSWIAHQALDAFHAIGVDYIGLLIFFYSLAALPLLLLPIAWRSFRATKIAHHVAHSDIIECRIQSAQARLQAWYVIGFGFAFFLIQISIFFIVSNQLAVGKTFFLWPLIRDSFGLILNAFGINIYIFLVAEILVLVWGLLIALARLAPGKPGRALRIMAIAYTDFFRGLPSIINLYLIGFGLPLAGFAIFENISPEWFAIIALTLTYGAYVAEVYRAGIESIHQSQISAARSLGLSYMQAMRHVILPQAIRRIGPPLLNDFIGLQKDTALVAVIGSLDAFNQSKIVAANHFNLSPVTTVAFLFVLILIPQTRLLDWWIARDQSKTHQ